MIYISSAIWPGIRAEAVEFADIDGDHEEFKKCLGLLALPSAKTEKGFKKMYQYCLHRYFPNYQKYVMVLT